MLTLIKGGKVIDPGNIDGLRDILVEADKIIKMIEPENSFGSTKSDTDKKYRNPEKERTEFKPDRIIDAAGKIITPGLIDMHVHLREPGHEYKETIESGCRAAAYGGFTTICCMPNTNPVNDDRQVTEYILAQALKADSARVLPVGAISKGIKGESLCEFGELKDAGAVAVSDDHRPVMNSLLMRRALEYAKCFGLLVISHCEDLTLVSNGTMNEGEIATKMGLSGISNAVEAIMVMRDIALCELTGVPIHIAHVSTKESVDAIRAAKKGGVPVTSETAPHYFSLTEEAVIGYNTNAKMNPPLRSERDKEAIKQGLADGTIDVIATDHAPHSDIEKDIEFDQAANGIIGLETSLSLGIKLVQGKVISLSTLIEKMSKNPARILGFNNDLIPGARAYLTIIDPKKKYIANAKNFQSKSRNTPFDGWEMNGKPILTMVAGRVVFEE